MLKIAELLETHFPEDLRSQAVAAVIAAYGEADERMKDFDTPERLNGIGVERKLLVDRALRATFAAYSSPSVQSVYRRNRMKSSAYSLLYAGDLCITPATTQYSTVLPHVSEFRKELALVGQLDFFKKDSPANGHTVHAVLTHGAWSIDATEPDWIFLLFPDSSARRLAAERVNLLMASRMDDQDVELDADVLSVPLRESGEREEGLRDETGEARR